MPKNNRAVIDDFLAQKRIAFVGLSRNPKDFSRSLYCELLTHGYDVVPVNPNVRELDQHRAYARVSDIRPPVDGALVLTSAQTAETVVRDCADAGIKRIWLYGTSGSTAASEQAIDTCRQAGMAVVAGECPFMFLSNTGVIHRIHGCVRKLFGTYPR